MGFNNSALVFCVLLIGFSFRLSLKKRLCCLKVVKTIRKRRVVGVFMTGEEIELGLEKHRE